MRFLLTMNMPSANGFLVHQLTVEVPVNSCEELMRKMNHDEFIMGRMFYRRRLLTGENAWEDRGDVILNTAHIGKVQEYFEIERESYDEPHGHPEPSNPHFAGERVSVRKRRNMF